MNSTSRSLSRLITKTLSTTGSGIRCASTKPCDLYLTATHVGSKAGVPKEQIELLKNAEKSLLPVYARPEEIVLSHGKGSYVFSVSGQKYLDFCAGIAVNSLGHGDEEFVKVKKKNFFIIIRQVDCSTQALTNQASKLIHSSNVYHNEYVKNFICILDATVGKPDL